MDPLVCAIETLRAEVARARGAGGRAAALAGRRVSALTYLDANATEPLAAGGAGGRAGGAGPARQPVQHPCRRAGGAAAAGGQPGRDRRPIRRAGPSGVVFTSGGTEADALAVAGLGAGRRLIIGATEHDAVRAAAPGAEMLPVDRDGVADLVGARAHAGGRAGAGVPDAGQQRDRDHPAGGRGRRALPPARRPAACRCGAGGRAHPGRSRARWAPTASRCRRTSSAARRAPARCCWPRGARSAR